VNEPEQLADDLWTWSGRRRGLPEVMRSYLLRGADDTLLVDPLEQSVGNPDLPAALDRLVGSRIRILITSPFHVRGAERLWARWRHDREVTIHGHSRVRAKLSDPSGFAAAAPGDQLDGGVRVHPLGRPARPEQPWEIAGHRALAFGDTVVEVDGSLRIWPRLRPDALAQGSYEEKLLPTIVALAGLDVDRVLVTHGDPVLTGGAAELAKACERPIWKRAALY
jgi:hypothetical protein